jgi:hypothetical protein
VYVRHARLHWVPAPRWELAGGWFFERRRFGFNIEPSFRYTSKAVPLYFGWIPLAAACGYLWKSDLTRRRRVRLGGCANCGYDLCGIAPGSMCPECGAEQ